MIKPNGERTWGSYRSYRNDPVFEVSFDGDITYPNRDKLPPIWITEPIIDDEGGYGGRTYTMFYPYPGRGFPFPGHDDEDGEDALYYGGCYYDEGMGYTDPADHDKRVDCFRAAELLYRHSAGRGNAASRKSRSNKTATDTRYLLQSTASQYDAPRPLSYIHFAAIGKK